MRYFKFLIFSVLWYFYRTVCIIVDDIHLLVCLLFNIFNAIVLPREYFTRSFIDVLTVGRLKLKIFNSGDSKMQIFLLDSD